MKYGKFITHPNKESTVYSDPWARKKFNAYDRVFEPGKGILNVKCEFSPDSSKELQSVKVRSTALGIFDLFINGLRVTVDSEGKVADELKPGWTDYRCRVFEFEYDVTHLIKENNVFVAEVSSGWWTGRISMGFYDFKPVAFAGEIELTYKDGTVDILASGTDWEASICGPVLRGDIWDGEYYDATIPEPSINPGAHTWEKAVLFDEFRGEIVPFEGEPIRSKPELMRTPESAVIHSGTIDNGTTYGEIKVVSKKTGDGCEVAHLTKDQAMILDFGQDMVGRPVLFLKAKRGTRIEVFFAEMLNDSGEESRGNDGPKGGMYIKNYRSAYARIVYIAAGSDEMEYYFPTHTFFGFRYVEIRTNDDIDVISVLGDVIRSDVKEVGTFFCDNPEVNQLYSNTLWGMRSNYLTVPTDCPQRDERLGWTGDTQIFCGAASYIGYTRTFLRKWLHDAKDSQFEYNGCYSDIIPRVFKEGFQGSAAWTDAGLIVPMRLYRMYNDTDVIADQFESMEQYMHWLEQFGYDGPLPTYGDWLNYDVTDSKYIGVAYYAYDCDLMTEFCEILGKADRAKYYRELREKIVAYWTEKYLDGTNLKIDTQTGYLLAIRFNLVEGELRKLFIEKLKNKIIANDYTLSTGFVGTGILNQTLAECGLDNLAYSLLLQTRDPSWLYSVRQGATTIWERWNSYTKETGFGNVEMNSFNHYSYGAVCEWMYANVCGIQPDPDFPGFEHFILRPTPDTRTAEELPAGQKNINMAKATYAACCCKAGDAIESGWERVNGALVYTFVIPEGLCARVELLSGKSMKINNLDYTVSELDGYEKDGRFVFELGTGKYVIEIK